MTRSSPAERSPARWHVPGLRAASALGAVTLILVSTLGVQQRVQAVNNGNGIMKGQGFDRCDTPSVSQMAAFFRGSPLWWYGGYLGGASYGCPGNGLTAAWLNTVSAQGWQFEYIWIGPQAPCTTFKSKFSGTPATAQQQGAAEASSAWHTMINDDGVANEAAGTPVVYDLEGPWPSSCNGVPNVQAAVNAFIQGWVNYLNSGPPAQIPGVYGSACASNLTALASLKPPPTFIWGADWGTGGTANTDTASLSCVPSGDWSVNQRLKQYHSGAYSKTRGYPSQAYEQYNGVCMQTDDDNADSFTTPSGSTESLGTNSYVAYHSGCLGG